MTLTNEKLEKDMWSFVWLLWANEWTYKSNMSIFYV